MGSRHNASKQVARPNGLARTGSFQPNAYSVNTGSPEMRDPLFSPEAFYLMNNDRKTINRWIRYYDTYHPILPNSLDIHALFPISDFSFKGVNDPTVSQFYDYVKNDVLKLLNWVILISSEYERLGEAFTFFAWDNYNGYYNSATILNPDLLEVYPFDWQGERKFVISMDIPETFQHLRDKKDVDSRYRKLWNALDPVIRRCIEGGLKIPLNPANVFGMQRLAYAYDVRGTSQVTRCFVAGTPVFMGDGTLKPIEEINCSDSCWTINGEVSPVIETVALDHDGELIDILVDSSENPIQCTPEHKFPVYITGRYCEECGKELTFAQFKRGQSVCSLHCNALKSSIFRKNAVKAVNPSGVVWRMASELKEGDILVSARQADTGNSPISLDKARLLGYFLAEGSYKKGRKGQYSGIDFSFCLDEKDTWVADVVSILKDMGIDSSLQKDRENGLRVHAYYSSETTELVEWLRLYAGEYSYGKKLPAEVLTWSLDLQKEILKGFCRGDGSISTYPELSCCTVSYNLAAQLSRIAMNLGLPHRFKKNLKKCDRHRDSYWLLFPGSVNKSFIGECFPEQVHIVNELGLVALDAIRELKAKGMTIKAIASKLNSDSHFKLNGKPWDVVTVSRALVTGSYGIKGKGRHTHLSVSDNYILTPIRKITRQVWSGKVYCVTVEDASHSISLNTVCVRNCLKDLMYEDKLREAQMAVADGHITPYQIWKIGNSQNGYIPTNDEIADWDNLLARAEHQNLFRIVTHSDVTYETKGVQEGLLNISEEMKTIEDRILTALYTSRAMTTGEGPCVTPDTEVLTEEGFKFFPDVTVEDKVASVNPETHEIEYCNPKEILCFDVTGDMRHFRGIGLDHLTTPNHRCLVSYDAGRTFDVVIADQVVPGAVFLSINPSGKKEHFVCSDIDRPNYTGKVYSMDLPPNRLYVSRRNGKICVTGNTYSNAIIGLKILEGRYQNKLYRIAAIIRSLFTKIAEANGFYSITPAQLAHGIRPAKNDRKLMLPTVHWDNYFSFSKDVDRAKFYLTLADAHRISYRRVLEILGLDFEEEQAVMKKDMTSLFEKGIYDKAMALLTGAKENPGSGVPTDLTAPPGSGEEASASEQALNEVGAEVPDGGSAPPLPTIDI